ncbi:RES domain-containing protein [Deltaproteobacteria bacterium TL4]
MIRLYRISKSKYADDISGEGARKAGGRWNLKGTPVIYTADSTALATLETLVHSPLNLIPKNRSMTIFELPDNVAIETIDLTKILEDWRSYPPPVDLGQLGTAWASQQRTVAFKVPSAIIPEGEDWNYLLNPYHPDFRKIQIIKTFPYEFDPRLYLRK